MKSKILGLLAVGLLAGPMAANAISFTWTWTGDSGYSASGTMSYSDALANTGVITAGGISTFTIQAFSGATSLFTWDLATGSQNNPFQLSFDTTNLNLVFGGEYPNDLNSVVWGNDDGSAGALICGTVYCGLLGENFVGQRSVSERQQFSFVQVAVPEPGTLALLGLGLAGLGLSRRRKAR